MTRARDISRLLGRTDNEVDSEGEIIASSGQIVDSAFVLSQTPAPATFQFYTTLDSLPSSPDAGALAFVEANTRMYLNDGDGWYSIAAVNLSPSLTLSPDGAITLASDGSTSTVTITATDTDDPSAILSYSVESDGNMLATGTTVTQDSSVFTITPLTQAGGGVAGNFTLSFKVSDQINEAVANKSFSLSFQSTGTLVRSASSVNEGSSVTFTLPVSGYTNGDTFPYTITGIQAADLDPATLSGNMVVSGGNASKVITTTADLTTEGAQTMTFNANSQSVNVIINDTSLTPPSPNIQLINEYYTTVNNSGSSSWTWSAGAQQSIGSNIDYTYVNGKPKTVVVNALTWKQTNNGTGNYLNTSYGMRSSNSGSNFWNLEQQTSFASPRNTGMAFGWMPAASIGFYKPKFSWWSGGVDYFQWSQWTLYAEAGIDTSLIYFNHNYYNGQGAVSTSTGATRKWDDYVMALGTVKPAPGSGSYPRGRMTYYSTYNMPIGQQGYMDGSFSSSGAYVHGRMDYYQYSSSIRYNTYPQAPHLSILHFRT